MKNPCERHTVVFIVRLWAEYLNQQPPSWRGVIEGREPGKATPFTSLEDLTTIIQEKTIIQSKMEADK
jgi:hypothetical protein